MSQLEIVRDWIRTDQQEEAFMAYEYMVYDCGRHPSKADFKAWYKLWCLNQNKLCDFLIEQI